MPSIAHKMRIPLKSLVLWLTTGLLSQCRTESEVYGTYNLIDGLKNNYLLQSSPTATAQPSQEPMEPMAQTDHSIDHSTGTESAAKNLIEEQSKQVSAPNIETTTEPPISAYQSPYNRIQGVKYNPLMARNIGLSSLMLSGVLYGLTVLPAILAITGASPLSGLFGSLGRRKRSLVNESHIFRQLPLLTNEETFKFLKLFESTLAARKIESAQCKQYYTCKVFYQVLKSGEKPKLSVFENAIVNVFGSVTDSDRRGLTANTFPDFRIAVERQDYKLQLIPTVKMYWNVAKDALRGESCARRYPCSLQAHQHYHHYHNHNHQTHHTKPGL